MIQVTLLFPHLKEKIPPLTGNRLSPQGVSYS